MNRKGILTLCCLLAAVIVFTGTAACAKNPLEDLADIADPEKLEQLQETIREEILKTQEQSGQGRKGADLTYWIASFFFSLLGLAMFIYGKKMADYKFLVPGLVMMIYPYFIHNGTLVVVVGLCILALVAAAARFL